MTFFKPANLGTAQEPCMRCQKPETMRGFFVLGDEEWTTAAMMKFVAIEYEEAANIARFIFEERGEQPENRIQTVFRLCRGCAALTDAPVYSLDQIKAGKEVKGIVQPK